MQINDLPFQFQSRMYLHSNLGLCKYNQMIYDKCMEFFDKLPISCILNGKFFCVHGGLSPELKNAQELAKLDRFVEIPKSGLFCDLMWSDPVDNMDGNTKTPFA